MLSRSIHTLAIRSSSTVILIFGFLLRSRTSSVARSISSHEASQRCADQLFASGLPVTTHTFHPLVFLSSSSSQRVPHILLQFGRDSGRPSSFITQRHTRAISTLKACNAHVYHSAHARQHFSEPSLSRRSRLHPWRWRLALPTAPLRLASRGTDNVAHRQHHPLSKSLVVLSWLRFLRPIVPFVFGLLVALPGEQAASAYRQLAFAALAGP